MCLLNYPKSRMNLPFTSLFYEFRYELFRSILIYTLKDCVSRYNVEHTFKHKEKRLKAWPYCFCRCSSLNIRGVFSPLRSIGIYYMGSSLFFEHFFYYFVFTTKYFNDILKEKGYYWYSLINFFTEPSVSSLIKLAARNTWTI